MQRWRQAEGGLLSIRDLLATAWPIVLITRIGFVFAYQFVEPAPPKHRHQQRRRERRLPRLRAALRHPSGGATVSRSRCAPPAGSLENVERLRKRTRPRSPSFRAAFRNYATVTKEAEASGLSLGSVSYEPVWVFYRSDRTD
jgi:hypothetical protein